jgi:hypothetical protein
MKVVAVILLFLTVSCASAQLSDDVTAILQQKDQALLDAIAPGDRAVWDKLLSSDFFYADENNRIISRADFLKELVPLPKGSSGNIAIKSYEAHRQGDTVIVIHRDDETEHYFGSELQAQYLMTETWQLFGDQWKLREIHCAAIPVDAPTVALTANEMDQLVGKYQAGTLQYTIRRDVRRLLGAQPGHEEVELKAETRDVLIIPGQPRSRKVFSRDDHGNVIGFSDRRENHDLIWLRTK